jgi:hypothetical protein
MTKHYSVSLTTNTATYTTTVGWGSEEGTVDEYRLAMRAVSRIYDEDGFDLSPLRWDIAIEELEVA